MTLKIGMVARCLNTEHVRGMGKYVYELISHAQRHPDLRWHLFANDTRYGITAPPGASLVKDTFAFRGDRVHGWEQLGLPLRVRRLDLDLLHFPDGTISLWQPKPTIITLHDTLAWEERGDTLEEQLYFEVLLPAALKKCAAIITGSDSARVDIVARWPWLEHKLSVIPHGIDEAFFHPEQGAPPAVLSAALGDSPYLVYLGGPLKRKRADWAIEVLAACRQPGLKLVICGYGSAARHEAIAALPPELQGRVLYAEFISDAEMRALYRGAQAVLYPTLYEGFGFPAVEAQAAGVPLIHSALGSLTELIGPLSIVVPPFELDAWVAAVQQAGALGEERAERARAAAQWVRRFAWSESFARHHALYRAVDAAQRA
jgi:alpha-1,3-rhamnosyl/mannosyltransferase